jgi:glycosyltransferase involved in cell wall biosynthesis
MPVPASRVRTPFDVAWLGARALERALERPGVLPTGPVVLHVWSPTALAWCLPLTAISLGGPVANETQRGSCLLAEAGGTDNMAVLARRYRVRSAGSRVAFVTPTETTRRRLMGKGVGVEDCVVIREFVDFAAIGQARLKDIRSQLDLADSDTVILALPPTARASGTFHLTWAALLLSKVRPEVRLVVPEVGPEVDRVERMLRSIRHQGVALLTRQHLSLPELLAAADLAAYLPTGDAPVTGLAWAMAAGKSIVAAAVPVVAELLAHGKNAWLCHPDSPKDATRRMLQALEQPGQSARQAETARSHAFQLFSRQRMVEQYERAYANLVEGDPVGEGIHDPATVS